MPYHLAIDPFITLYDSFANIFSHITLYLSNPKFNDIMIIIGGINMTPYGVDRPLETFGKPFVPDVVPGKKFIKRVEKDLPLDANNLSIALKLYNNLNEVVEYSPEFLAFNQDLSMEFIKRIYDMSINKINLTDNQVTCKNWSFLYAFFLNKHNIPCVVNNSGVHYSIYLKEEGYLFNVDATTVNKDEQDNLKMDDLTRSKLGLRPNGFRALVVDDEIGVKKVNVYDLGLSLDKSTDIDYINFEDRTNNLVRKLKECNSFKIHNLPEVTDNITDIFDIINNLLLQESDLGSVSAISYINSLIKVLFNEEEQMHLAYVQVKEKYKKDNYSYSEVINYNPNEIRKHRHDYPLGMPNLEGYNFIYRDGSIEYLTKRKARHVIENSMEFDMGNSRGDSL